LQGDYFEHHFGNHFGWCVAMVLQKCVERPHKVIEMIIFSQKRDFGKTKVCVSCIAVLVITIDVTPL
jgi:hypothetical protein